MKDIIRECFVTLIQSETFVKIAVECKHKLQHFPLQKRCLEA